MRALALIVLGACARAPSGAAVKIAPASPSTVSPINAEPRTPNTVAPTWSFDHPVYSRAIVGDALIVAPEIDERFHVIDLATGQTRVTGEAGRWMHLYAAGDVAIAAFPDRLEALDARGASRFTIPGLSNELHVVCRSGDAIHLLAGDAVRAYDAESGRERWRAKVPERADSLACLGESVLAWRSQNEPPSGAPWRVLAGSDGAVVRDGEAAGARFVAQGSGFYICSERAKRLARYDDRGGERSSFAYEAPCRDVVADDAGLYAIALPTDVSEMRSTVRALTPSGDERWRWSGPAAHGAIVHGPWLLVPSAGGVIRALRRSDGALAWSYGVGRTPTFEASGDVLIAVTNERVRAFRFAQTSEPETTTVITLDVRAWRCRDSGGLIVVGDAPAQEVSEGRWVARVAGRGTVVVAGYPQADVSLVPPAPGPQRPLEIDLDGRPHRLEIELDACEDD